MPLPRPTKKVPKNDKNRGSKILFKKYKCGITPPIVIAIIKIFIIVPIPGFNLRGTHNKNTKTLIIKVERPIPTSIFSATPSAKTVHGVTPLLEITNTLSPKPKINKPKQREKNVFNLGLKNSVFNALQEV